MKGVIWEIEKIKIGNSLKWRFLECKIVVVENVLDMIDFNVINYLII